MQNTKHHNAMQTQTLQATFSYFLEYLGTEKQIEADIKLIQAKIKEQLPDADDYQLNYWTARIYFFTGGETGNFTFTTEPADEPTTISLTFHPDYSS